MIPRDCRTLSRQLLYIAVAVSLSLLVAGCGLRSALNSDVVPQQQTITDMAGRTVTVPSNITKIYATSPVGTIFVYTLAPEKLGSWNYYMATRDSKYILPECRDLPVIGGWLGTNNFGNVEDILKLKPDIILLSVLPGRNDTELAEKIQQQTAIPVVVVDVTTDKMDKAYEFTGKLLKQEERAAILAGYCRETVADIEQKRSRISANKKVYYAEGIKGLETEPKGSWHTEAIEMVGGENVAGADIMPGGQIGRSQVSFEQVLAWAPDVIVVGYFPEGESSSYENILNEDKWQNLKAVREHHVYEVPNSPFNWIDRPPSVNRLIGIKWLSNLFYPEVYNYDMPAEIKRFYDIFYHYKLSDQEVNELLERSGGAGHK